MNVEIKHRYSDTELVEFENIILEKLTASKAEFNDILRSLRRTNDTGTENTSGSGKTLEDGADNAEKENMTQLANRLQKFINQLESALHRIKNKTYGVCIESGKLIPKERLRLVPHTQHTIEAKMGKA